MKENVTLITKIFGEIPDTTMASFGPQVSKKTIANREQTSSNFPRSWAQ